MSTSKAAASSKAYSTKTDTVYKALRRAILAGDYLPGDRIVADLLAQELGVSKVPVREALVRLAGEGWLRIKPHVGAVVCELSSDEIIETSLMRAAVESVAVRLSAERLTRQALKQARALVERMDAAAATDDPEYPRLNFEFHVGAVQACPYPALRELAASLTQKTYRLRTVRFLPEYLPESQGEHHELLEALERRDGKTAERIDREHIERAGQLLWQFSLTRD